MSRTNVVDKPQSLDYSVGERNRVQFKYYCLNYVRPSPCVDCNSSLGPDEPKPTWLQTSSSRAPAGDAFVHVVLTGHASAAASMSDASTYTRDRGRLESLPFCNTMVEHGRKTKPAAAAATTIIIPCVRLCVTYLNRWERGFACFTCTWLSGRKCSRRTVHPAYVLPLTVTVHSSPRFLHARACNE